MNRKGITLVELMVAIVIIGVLGMVVIYMFKYGWDSWQIGTSKMSLNSKTRTAISNIEHDLKGAERCTINNFMPFRSGSFEWPVVLETDKRPVGWGWTTAIPSPSLPANIERTGEVVNSGYCALRILETSAGGAAIQSSNFILKGGEKYILSCWSKNSDTTAAVLGEIGIDAPDGSFGYTSVSIDTTVDYWKQYSVSFVTPAGDRDYTVTLKGQVSGANKYIYFDDVSVSFDGKANFVTNGTAGVMTTFPSSPNDGFIFETASTLDSQRAEGSYFIVRLRLDTTDPDNLKIFREKGDWDSANNTLAGTWSDIGTNPLIENINTFYINNIGQNFFDVYIESRVPRIYGPNKGDGWDIYKLKTRIYPSVP